jgi:hypothetical protein
LGPEKSLEPEVLGKEQGKESRKGLVWPQSHGQDRLVRGQEGQCPTTRWKGAAAEHTKEVLVYPKCTGKPGVRLIGIFK